MKLEVLRFSSGKDSTSGILFDVTNGKRKFLCYTLEDEQRDVKVYGETRIPPGTYVLSLRTVGGFHTKYSAKYGNMHKGMIWVQDVPGFEYILWHTGNTDEHTAGCLILGNSQTSNLVQKDGFVGSSVDAYKSVYPYVVSAIENGQVEVTYTDYDGDVNTNDNKDINTNDILEKLNDISGKIIAIDGKLSGRRFF